MSTLKNIIDSFWSQKSTHTGEQTVIYGKFLSIADSISVTQQVQNDPKFPELLFSEKIKDSSAVTAMLSALADIQDNVKKHKKVTFDFAESEAIVQEKKTQSKSANLREFKKGLSFDLFLLDEKKTISVFFVKK